MLAAVFQVLLFAVVSAVIYFGIVLAALLFGKPGRSDQVEEGLDFSELMTGPSGAPELQSFQARDGARLEYRHYPADSNRAVILLHGSGSHSRYLFPLADYLRSEGLARVYTPDLRGHGSAPERRGDIDYIGQLEDDLADLIEVIKRDHPGIRVVVGGHSSGGGLAVRFAGGRHGGLAEAYLLLAPYLKYNAPTMRNNSGGWARPYVGRIIGLSMLNNLGIHALDDLPVIEFNMPRQVRDGTETLVYTQRLNTGLAPRNYKKDLAAVNKPLLVVSGSADESFYGERFGPVIKRYTEAEVELLKGVTHMGVVVGPEIRPVIRDWLEGLDRM